VGRLDAFKDPLTFIRACAVLKQQGVSFVAPIAGDGDLMAQCQQELQRYALHDRVILLGIRLDPERLFRIATATVHISPIENTWANVIAEAMFMEVPVVLSNAGYTQRLFTHEKDCLIVPPQNPASLAGALQRLIEDGPLRTQLTRGARELLRQYKKDRASIVHEVRAYYDEIQWHRIETSRHA
jgi:glycosyltransferase involved in cell wall biosynthesis